MRIVEDTEMRNVPFRRYRRGRRWYLKDNPNDAHRNIVLTYWDEVFGWWNI